uniref:NADH dehydrogenase subunit 6 n=1 Tax=Bruchidius siliquastri TaxID=1649775 RepID=UPI0022A6DAC9|nr:NADH dehydrogenase subunit 6 [Bruchidius siliquastri]UZT27035.1 NADH dehydrogenase subunit 6 [Bruchidius siliquastri]
MVSMLMISMLTMAIMFIFLSHPLTMGMILLIQTIMTALLTGLMNYNFWFSYILFLIMIGGMLILFIYMTSIASNEKFKFSPTLSLIFTTNMTMMLLLAATDHYFSSIMTIFTMDLMKQDLNINNFFSMSKYFNYPNNMIIYMMIIYLLITLIMVVKITNIKYGPMRHMY